MSMEPPAATGGQALAPAVTQAGSRVSILVVNYNGASLLKDCLESVGQISQPELEVIVVDNGSTDNSLEVLAGFPRVKVVRSSSNLGFAGGNNLGLQRCSGDYVLLLNNDTIVSRDFLQPLCDYLDSNPHVGIVQGKMLLPKAGNTLDVCGSFLTALGLPYHYGFYKPDGPKYKRHYPVFSAKGACLMFRRNLISEVGGFLFDPDFFCYYEETDFCHRAWLAGCEVHFVSGPPILHFMGSTAGGPQGAFVLRHYLRNMAFSLFSNLSPTSRLRILPPFLLTLFVSLLGALLTLRMAHVAAHWGALTCWLSARKAIQERRRLIGAIRKQPDQWIFERILRTPHLDYFLKTFTGRLDRYADREVN